MVAPVRRQAEIEKQILREAVAGGRVKALSPICERDERRAESFPHYKGALCLFFKMLTYVQKLILHGQPHAQRILLTDPTSFEPYPYALGDMIYPFAVKQNFFFRIVVLHASHP